MNIMKINVVILMEVLVYPIMQSYLWWQRSIAYECKAIYYKTPFEGDVSALIQEELHQNVTCFSIVVNAFLSYLTLVRRFWPKFLMKLDVTDNSNFFIHCHQPDGCDDAAYSAPSLLVHIPYLREDVSLFCHCAVCMSLLKSSEYIDRFLRKSIFLWKQTKPLTLWSRLSYGLLRRVVW